MKIKVINFEVNPEHYQITRMLKTNKDIQIEYCPFHCFEKNGNDCWIIISKKQEEQIIQWCKKNDIDERKVIVVTDKAAKHLLSWEIGDLFEKEIDFEKLCQWLMEIVRDKEKVDLYQNLTIETGKIRKEHDLYLCAQAIWKHHPKLKNDKEVHLFVKEKNPIVLNSSIAMDYKLHQHHIKGISEYYEYLIIKKEKKKKSQ